MYNFVNCKVPVMESKLNLEATIKYSEEFSGIMCDRFFAKESRISGEQILSFSNIKQVNLFVVRILFSKWHKEQQKLKSPYFDYNAPDVAKSLQDFLNILSKNISIGRDDFYPLLKLACIKTIQVIYAPYDFFVQEISGDSEGRVSVKKLKESAKYLKINSGLFDALLEKIDATGKSELASTDANAILEDVFLNYEGDPEDGDTYLPLFNEVLELKIQDLFISIPEGSQSEEKPSYSTLNDDHANRIGETVGDALKKINPVNLQESISVNQKFMFVHVLFSGNPKSFEESLNKIAEMQSKDEIKHFLEDELSQAYSWDKESEEVSEFYDLVLSRFD